MGDYKSPYKFRPERIAYYEANGWRAYYDHRWLRLLGLIVNLSQEQFRIPFPLSLLAAYHITQASIAWVPLDHDKEKVKAGYEAFYRLARRFSGLDFDPVKAAEYEIEYNDVHRSLAGQPDKSGFIRVMVELHSTIFGISFAQALTSAELRVQANNTVDLITSKTSKDPEADWRLLENYLAQCYRSIQEEIGKNGDPFSESYTANKSQKPDQPL